jgi:predicted NBD/HSP70 family sugar kinase
MGWRGEGEAGLFEPMSAVRPACRCGNRGCLEAFAGGWAIAARALAGPGRQPMNGQLTWLVDGGRGIAPASRHGLG